MNIAYVHTGDWPSASPSFTFATMTAVALAGKFDTCYFFIKKNSDHSPHKVLRDHFDLEKPANLNVFDIKNPVPKTNRIYYRIVFRELAKLAKQKKLDAVITRNNSFLPFLKKLKDHFGIPVFFESHDFYADLSVRDDINIKKKRKQSRLEQKYIPHLSGVICLQNEQKDLYEKTFPNTSTFLARTGFYQFYKSAEKRTFVTYVGSLDPHKGIELLIKALNKTSTKPHLMVIGGKNESDKAKINSLAEQFYSQEKVTLTGWLNKEQLHEKLSQTALGIVPLRDNFFNCHLTSPLKIFDYLSYGIPIVASDLPTCRELIDDGKSGVFFEPGNEADLAQKIDDLFKDENRLNDMQDYIYENCHTLLWSERANRIYDIVKSFRETNHA